ncbi:MAG: LacI family transcriptional regulator, gluconate utilization system Gnt-I transcriptional repressor [Subtercola sp.]|nr:LacI family transcriptional regulator, gluconate utilization system Gnt-I transcriptional repressor [Subtercola sp.]
MARIAGVSSQTVSRVIRNHDDVSVATRQRVEEAISSSGYVPNLTAANLASNTSKLVATIVPSISTSVFSETMAAASEVLAPEGYQLILGFTNYEPLREEELVRNLLGRRPDGVFLIGVTHTENAVRMLKASGIPVVETWGSTPDPVDDLVGFSNEQAMYDLVSALTDQGYRRPTFAGSMVAGDHRAIERFDGYRRRFSELFPGEPVRFVDASDSALTFASGEHLLGRAFEAYPDTDLLLFATDILANGAILAASRQGLSVPGDLAISGFGDFELSSALTPSLSTVSIRTRHMGEVAARMLLERMASKSAVAGGRSVDIGYEITLRESS